jgi:hypothetical protein
MDGGRRNPQHADADGRIVGLGIRRFLRMRVERRAKRSDHRALFCSVVWRMRQSTSRKGTRSLVQSPVARGETFHAFYNNTRRRYTKVPNETSAARRRGSGSGGTHALSDAPAWAIRLNTLDFRGLISRRGTYHIAFDHGGAAMMHGAIVMGRPCFVCRWRQPPPATMWHCEWRRVWLVRGQCHECRPLTQISIGGMDVATDRLFVLHDGRWNATTTTRPMDRGWVCELLGRPTWRIQKMLRSNPTLVDGEGERERARRIFLCRSLFLVNGLLIRYLFVRSWHLPATAMMMMT